MPKGSSLSPLQFGIGNNGDSRDGGYGQDSQHFIAIEEPRVRLAIDDFGTGYSSLNYPRRLPFDTLKIDRSFISNVGGGNDERDIVAIIVMLARDLGLHAVAEGLETAEHLNHLQDLKCESGQGYFFSKPTDEETMSKLLLGSRHREGNLLGRP